MSEATLETIAAALTIAAVLGLIHILRRRTVPAVDGDPEPFARASNPDAPAGSREFAPLVDLSTWQSEVVTDLAVVEELLDRAEAEWYQEREVIMLGLAMFLVRWRRRG